MERDDFVEGEIRVERVNFAREGSGDGLRVERRSDEQVRAAGEILKQRHVEEGFRCFANALVFGILGYPDYLHPASLNLNALADGILADPILSGHGLIHDGDQSSFLVVGAGEFAAGD